LGRFERQYLSIQASKPKDVYYRLSHPAANWGSFADQPLDPDGGKSRGPRKAASRTALETAPERKPPLVRDRTPRIRTTKPKKTKAGAR
jgi:hypothetical protein